jgi:hypothetical protein
MNQAWQRRITYLLLAVFVGLLLASLPGRYMHGDDAWLGEQAYWLAATGFVRSDLFRGFLDYNERQMVFHKLFIAIGALVIKIFGWSLYNLKAISLASLGCFFVTSYLYLRRSGGLLSKDDFWLLSLVMISAPLIFRYSYVYRPEVMLMAVGFASFCLVTSALGGRWGAAAAGGAFAGLGLLVHLNGWVFVLAGMVLLLAHRRLRAAAAFGVAACAVFSLYFSDLTSADTLRHYWSQVRNDLPIGEMSFWRRLLNVAYEPKRFFYSAREIFHSTLLVLSLVLCWRTLRARCRDTLIYLGVLVVALAVLSRPRPSFYIVIYMPYIALIITAALKSLGPMDRARRSVLLIAAALAFAYSFYHSIEVIKARSDLPGINSQIASYLEPGSAIVAPAGFIFNEIARFRIQSLTFYDRWAERSGTRLTPETFFDLARSYGNAYVVLDREFSRKIGLETPTEGSRVGSYAMMGEVHNRLVFRCCDCGS